MSLIKINYIKIIGHLSLTGLLISGSITCSLAQAPPPVRQCATMQVLEHAFNTHPLLKAGFENQTAAFQQSVNKRKAMGPTLRVEQDVIYVPIVFHIVLTDPTIITDAQIQAQLNVLNKDFGGLNRDSVNLPAAFKPLFGKSKIQFKLAQRTPGNESTTGIIRTTTTTPVYGTYDTALKYTTRGGDDAWDRDRYFNVWVTNLAFGLILGYSTLPGASKAAEDGVVIHYTTLPADSLTKFNRGRTLTHETGHYFYLYHIWGDENGCTGTDFVDDTPNQGSFTGGCPSGIITDGCSPTAPGILYEDYMDYTDDACMCLFTREQDTRMETALIDYRPGYLTSNGADPLLNPNLRAKGFMITPNPTTNVINVQFYPYPATLKGIVIYNISGQKVAEQPARGPGATVYSFDLSLFANGIYEVQAIYSDQKRTQKVIKH
jgi:hypothetical protein